MVTKTKNPGELAQLEGTGPPGIGAWPAGDVDADGRADLLVAMPIANTTYEKAGAVFLFTGAQAVEEMGP